MNQTFVDPDRSLYEKVDLSQPLAIAMVKRLAGIALDSGLFNPHYYLSRDENAQVYLSAMKTRLCLLIENKPFLLAQYYINEGWRSGVAPSAFFDQTYYWEGHARQEIQKNCSALVHFLVKGRFDERSPSRFFNYEFYKNQWSDSTSGGADPLLHYLTAGWKEGLDPSFCFSTAYYLNSYPDVAASGMQPLQHFLEFGKKEGRRCHPVFDINACYESGPENPDVRFLPSGWKLVEGEGSYEAGKVNVLLVGHSAQDVYFGAERSFVDMVKALSTINGVNLIVALPNDAREYIRQVRSYAARIYIRKYSWWKYDQPLDPLTENAFEALLKRERIKLVHVNTIVVREPLTVARKLGLITVVHVRELIIEDPDLCRTLGGTATQLIQKVQDTSDFLIANSRATFRTYQKPGHTFLVPNTLDVTAFYQRVKKLKRQYPADQLRVGLISSNTEKKGVEDFLRLVKTAVHEVPEARFVLIGPPSAYLQSLLQRDEFSPEALASLEMHGYTSRPEEAQARVDIVVNFSHFTESFGRTILEAMAAKHPVIVYDWGALSELVVHEKTGIIIPYRSPLAAISFLQKLIRDPKLIQQMGEAGYQRALKHFDRSRYLQQFDRVYRDILDNNYDRLKKSE